MGAYVERFSPTRGFCGGTSFCVEAVQEAIDHYGVPEIFNMDGRGAWRDNVFVERLWRSVKYDEVYLHAYSSVIEARQGLDRYFRFYNQIRPHSSFDKKTPDEFYFENLPRQHCAA